MAFLGRLPVPTLDLWEWQEQGACQEADSRLFFHPEAERGPARRKRASAALAFCARCPVMRECREHGLKVREPYGIWGGLTEEDRTLMWQRESDQPHEDQDPVAPGADR
jgi:WhiB family redox-sensing transcriptional regulator